MTGRARSPRHQRILQLFDPSTGSGLEIGPLFDPVVLRPDGNVRYVDVHPAEKLREHYRSHPGVPVDDIVDADIVLIGPELIRTLPEAVGGAESIDWVVASHVLEHVPDVVGWLQEVADVLRDRGPLVLAIPDRRYSFDADRTPTTVGEMLLAHEHQDTIPSVRAIYDHFSRAVRIAPAAAWEGASPTSAGRIHGLPYVRQQLELAADGSYVDCHVWLFTPESFVEQLGELAKLGLIDFVVDRVIPTAEYENEFYAALRRLPRDVTADERAAALEPGLRGVASPADPAADRVGGVLQPWPTIGPLSPRERTLINAKRALMTWMRGLVSQLGRLRRRTA